MAKIPKEILDIARNHHRQLLKLDKKARRRVEKEMAIALEKIKADLAEIPAERFRAQQLRMVGFLADLTERVTSDSLENVLEDSVRAMYKLAPGHTEKEVNGWLEYYGGEARPINLAVIAELTDETIIDRIPSSLNRWGKGVSSAVKRELSLLVATKGDRTQAVDAIERAIGAERWKARRIVRTELIGAYNKAHHQSLIETRKLDGMEDLKKSAIATFDSRTAEDSRPMHGQVRELEENFVDGAGRSFLHPPGRPNDREKEIPFFGPGDIASAKGLKEHPEEQAIAETKTQNEAEAKKDAKKASYDPPDGFEWDPNKDKANQVKHDKVTFAEASTIFGNIGTEIMPDESESGEENFLAIGTSSKLKLLVVCHCIRYYDGDVEKTRIISARKAEKPERKAHFKKK